MFNSPVQYDEPLFRPPSEAYSLILQPTIGCSWNRCAFCEMYSTKKFRVKKEEDIIQEIDLLTGMYPDTRKVFLADGNAMVLTTAKLIKIITRIKDRLPKLNRISAYALPKDILLKTEEELKQLREAGLKLIYVGIESGDEELLKLIKKGETVNTTIDGLLKAKASNISSSVMILTGLGGKNYFEQHAINSAEIINKIQPEFVSTLVLSFPFGVEKYKERFQGIYSPMTTFDLIKELELFIQHTELTGSIFRSDHASNYLVLKGILSRDKQKFLDQISYVLNNPENANLREEWQRGL